MRNFKITVNGNVYDVSVEELSANIILAPAPVPVTEAAIAPVQAPAVKPAPVAVKAEPAPAPAPVKKAVAGGVQIKSPMPGMVSDFKVSEGSAVKKGEVILILEAMKMENDICAPADGTVSFAAAKGSNVNTGDVLAVIS